MTGWAERVTSIKRCDRVAYSGPWRRSTGQMTGDAPRARGRVNAVEQVGSLQLAVIRWDQPDLPERVNVKNLSRIKDGVIIERD